MSDRDYAVTSTRFTAAWQECRNRITADVASGAVAEGDAVLCEATVKPASDRSVQLLGSNFTLKGRLPYALLFRGEIAADRRLQVKEARVVFNAPKPDGDDDRPAVGRAAQLSKQHFFYCFGDTEGAAPTFIDIPTDRANAGFVKRVQRDTDLLKSVDAAWTCTVSSYFNVQQIMVLPGGTQPKLLTVMYYEGRLLSGLGKVLEALDQTASNAQFDLGPRGYYAQPSIKPFLAEIRRHNKADNVGPVLQFVAEQLDAVPHRTYDERLVGGGSSLPSEIARQR